MSRPTAITDIFRRYQRDAESARRQAEAVRAMPWRSGEAEAVDAYIDGLLTTSAGFLGWNQVTDRYALLLHADGTPSGVRAAPEGGGSASHPH